MKVGEYVNYPVSYTNVATRGSGGKSGYSGWRVVYNDGKTVKIATAGTPLTYSHNNNANASVTALTTNFKTTFSDFYNKCVSGNAGKFTTNVSSFSKTEVDKIVGTTTGDNYGVGGNNLLHNGSTWWMATAVTANRLPYLNSDNGRIDCNHGYTATYGIRPMITLNASTVVTGGSGTSTSPWTIDI